MQDHASRSMTLVIYAEDPERLASFYEAVLDLERESQEDHFVLLGLQGVELALVKASTALREAVDGQSSQLRSETPIKPSFCVADVEGLRGIVEAAGGGLQPPASAWVWRGALHLDGHDPEGIVFQLRQPVG